MADQQSIAKARRRRVVTRSGEHYGRCPITLLTFALFFAFQLACAFAPFFPTLLLFRLLTGIGASTPVSVTGGIYADAYRSAKYRGRAMTGFITITTWGPLLGPIISGHAAESSWRWPFRIGSMIAGATWPMLFFLPETFGPVIWNAKAKRLRKQGNTDIYASSELQKHTWQLILTIILARPIRMFLTESIVLFSSLYIALVYATFYLYFQAYPLIFPKICIFSASAESLTFIPIGIGALFTGLIHIAWDKRLETVTKRMPTPAWTEKEEYRRLPIACLGAPLFTISLFCLGWTAKKEIPWIVPTLSGMPFGIGYTTAFIVLLNYIVDAYEMYDASALGTSLLHSQSLSSLKHTTDARTHSSLLLFRSILGILLPFVAQPMYTRLGVAWACSVLGFISLVMGIIPFVFIKYGQTIRARSKMVSGVERGERERWGLESEGSGFAGGLTRL